MSAQDVTPIGQPTDGDLAATATKKLVALLGNPYGCEVLADTNAHTGTANSGRGYCKIENAASGVISTMTASDINAGVAVTSYTMAAGEVLVGNFSTITLTSGKVKAFLNP